MSNVIERTLEGVLATLMLVMTLVVVLGVFFRYVLLAPLTWPEEVARTCLVWVTFVGSYVALRRGAHIAVDVFLLKMSAAVQRLVRIAVLLLMGAFMATLLFKGVEYVQNFMGTTTPLLGIPMSLVYGAMPLFAMLVLMSLLSDVLKAVRSGGMRLPPSGGDAT